MFFYQTAYIFAQQQSLLCFIVSRTQRRKKQTLTAIKKKLLLCNDENKGFENLRCSSVSQMFWIHQDI